MTGTSQTTRTVAVIENPAAAHAALSPLRLELLRQLDQPASATELAARLSISRQRLTYHLHVLERHGLIALAEERRRRGFIERRYRRKGNLVVAPDIVAREPSASEREEMSADAVMAAASDAIRAVGTLSRQAAAAAKHLVTATLTTDVTFASPADLRRFLDGVAALAARYDKAGSREGAPHRITLISHPQPSEDRVRP